MSNKEGIFKAERKKVKNVRCYRIGSKEKYPHWLAKAIAQGYIIIEKNVEGLTDVVTFYRGQKKKHFYDDDYIVKLPEGPIIGVDHDKFHELYIKQNPDAWVVDIVNKSPRCPEWATKAVNNNIIRIYELADGNTYIQFKKDRTYYAKGLNDKITFKEIFMTEDEKDSLC